MKGFLLVVIAVIALLAAFLLLKKRTSHKKTPQIEVVDHPETAAQATQPASIPAEEAPTATVAIEEESVALHIETTLAAEAVIVGGTAALSSPDNHEELVVAELEEVESESFEEATEAGCEEAPVALGGRLEPVSLERVPASEQLVAQPDEARETESVPVAEEAVTPVALVEIAEEAQLSEPVAEPQSAPVGIDVGLPAQLADSVAEVGSLSKICLTMEAYSARLNGLEEKQRTLLASAIRRRDDTLRDQLQRELVIMNDKLALLADSYAEEMPQYQQILDALERLDGGEGLAVAKENLKEGESRAAEDFFAQLSAQQDPLAAEAAFHSGQLAECRVDLQTALAMYRRAVEKEPENLLYLQAAGKTARSIYHYKEALSWLESLVMLAREKKDMDPVDQALAQRELAYTYVLSGQYQKAGPLYKESMTILAKKLGQDHPEMATSWYQLGELQETLGEYDKAVSLYKKSLEILEKKRGLEHPVLANILDKLAALCMELELEKQAVPLYERLVRIREKALRPTHPQLALSLNNLAESYRLQGQYAEAEACYQKSLIINETIHGMEHPSVAAVLQELAKLCNSQRKPEEAQQYQQRATAIFQKSVEASEKKTGQEALTLEI